MKLILIFLCSLSFPMLIAKDLTQSQLIVWNVGQGQWITYNNENFCLHFDMGGEKAPLLEIQKLCYKKRNILYLSHWDLDHISFIRKFSSRVFQFCLAGKPLASNSVRKQNFSKLLPECEIKPTSLVEEIYSGNNKTANSVSRVFYLKPLKLIIPGDSTKSEEVVWSELVPKNTRGLILGHHGSKTSSSDELLDSLADLQWSVSSARKAKYGHPHREVITRLKTHHAAVLKTEDWGNIRMLSAP